MILRASRKLWLPGDGEPLPRLDLPGRPPDPRRRWTPDSRRYVQKMGSAKDCCTVESYFGCLACVPLFDTYYDLTFSGIADSGDLYGEGRYYGETVMNETFRVGPKPTTGDGIYCAWFGPPVDGYFHRWQQEQYVVTYYPFFWLYGDSVGMSTWCGFISGSGSGDLGVHFDMENYVTGDCPSASVAGIYSNVFFSNGLDYSAASCEITLV